MGEIDNKISSELWSFCFYLCVLLHFPILYRNHIAFMIRKNSLAEPEIRGEKAFGLLKILFS